MNSPRPRVRPAVPGARSVDTGPVLFLLFALSSRAHQRFTNLWWIPTRPSEGGGSCLFDLEDGDKLANLRFRRECTENY
jgi:hypothetical protein